MNVKKGGFQQHQLHEYSPAVGVLVDVVVGVDALVDVSAVYTGGDTFKILLVG